MLPQGDEQRRQPDGASDGRRCRMSALGTGLASMRSACGWARCGRGGSRAAARFADCDDRPDDAKSFAGKTVARHQGEVGAEAMMDERRSAADEIVGGATVELKRGRADGRACERTGRAMPVDGRSRRRVPEPMPDDDLQSIAGIGRLEKVLQRGSRIDLTMAISRRCASEARGDVGLNGACSTIWTVTTQIAGWSEADELRVRRRRR